jgi:SAM-dependent methyltransferase
MKSEINHFLNKYFHINIKLLEIGRGRESDRYSYQKQYIDFDIKPDERVLDIGSGGYPFPLATHLADFHEGETTHRTESLQRDHRPFTVCNIQATPFTDKEFDFVYCSHVLEHVEHPDQACDELMRIGKRGYIEAPSRISDIMFNFTRIQNHHRWHTLILENTLLFIEWQEKEKRDTKINDFYGQFHSEWQNPFQDLMHHHRDLFVSMMLWEERFDYVVISKHGEIIKSTK